MDGWQVAGLTPRSQVRTAPEENIVLPRNGQCHDLSEPRRGYARRTEQ